ncbi:MAG: hypothetical protein KJ667_01340 [Alphaproteobacteria bacterium]|nr:hypothetical protein [Alphaproteobacteria bacterium]
MGLLRTAFILITKPSLMLAQFAYVSLWHNRGALGRTVTAAALVTTAGLLLHNGDDERGVPPVSPEPMVDPYFNDKPATQPGNGNGGMIEVPMIPGVEARAPADLIARTYIETIYDVATTNYLNSLPAGERAAKAESVATNRALLLDALTKFEALEIDTSIITEQQAQQMAEMRANTPNRSEQFYRDMVTSSDILEMRLRARTLLERHPELVVSEEQAAAMDERMRTTPGTHANTSVIGFLTDSYEARERGLRSYYLDRQDVLERANDNIIVVPMREGSLQTTGGNSFSYFITTRPPSIG